MRQDVRSLLDAADHVLIAFDGPLCTVFDPSASRGAAERLRLLLGANLPRNVARSDDPFEVLRYASSCGENTAYVVERQLSAYEAEAVAFGAATDGVVDAMRTLNSGGHSVTAVGNQSVQAIRSFLTVHDLLGTVRRISGRVDARTTKLLPDPFLLNQVIEAVGTVPRRCLLIGATAADAQAAQAAGIPVLGYGAAVPRKLAAATIESMTELVVEELLNWPVR
ncbi:MAG TPA: HAD hydrolase-like protein [Pseudonocardiaceae bacterium]|nr:HAD hydrolase-like protein [Pseudonocardiaceae bacterium]